MRTIHAGRQYRHRAARDIRDAVGGAGAIAGALGKENGAHRAPFHLIDAVSGDATRDRVEYVDYVEYAATSRARTIVSAASSIMSSCPPTSRCRPSSTRMSRAGIPYFASARFANSRNDE